MDANSTELPTVAPRRAVDDRFFDGRRTSQPSRCRPVTFSPKSPMERDGYPSDGTLRTGATGTACSHMGASPSSAS
ncbi:hypothetical protein B0H19DRAFT_1196592 [Mycena capillaripes]|nr:hypothetical protein B0H19DRAFT_1196592 [Mycena capillaripes]